MNKPIVSRDPRKPAIVAALKSASNCRKVTSVRQTGPDTFEGNCMNPNGANAYVGTVQITLSQAVLGAAEGK